MFTDLTCVWDITRAEFTFLIFCMVSDIEKTVSPRIFYPRILISVWIIGSYSIGIDTTKLIKSFDTFYSSCIKFIFSRKEIFRTISSIFFWYAIHFLYKHPFFFFLCHAFYCCSTLEKFTFIVIDISYKYSLITTSVDTIWGRSFHITSKNIVYSAISLEGEGIEWIGCYESFFLSFSGCRRKGSDCCRSGKDVESIVHDILCVWLR
jgi:hypothetical protein